MVRNIAEELGELGFVCRYTLLNARLQSFPDGFTFEEAMNAAS